MAEYTMTLTLPLVEWEQLVASIDSAGIGANDWPRRGGELFTRAGGRAFEAIRDAVEEAKARA